MNPVALIHVAVGVLVMCSSVPLIRRKVGMNAWYGVRIPQSFESQERWFEINAYGGWLILAVGAAIAGTGAVGAALARSHWVLYNFAALGVILCSVALAVAAIYRHARAPRP
jgi:hypothetical protein